MRYVSSGRIFLAGGLLFSVVSAIVFVILGIYVKMRGRVETPSCEYRHSAGDR